MADQYTTSHYGLAHHFDNMEQQKEAGTLGMWAFLITEIMFFGGMFLAYILYRRAYGADFAYASAHLNWKLGAANTVVLIVSSLQSRRFGVECLRYQIRKSPPGVSGGGFLMAEP